MGSTVHGWSLLFLAMVYQLHFTICHWRTDGFFVKTDSATEPPPTTKLQNAATAGERPWRSNHRAIGLNKKAISAPMANGKM